MQTVLINCSNIVVGKDVWVTSRGEIGHAKAEVVRLDDHIALLYNCNDTLYILLLSSLSMRIDAFLLSVC